MTAIPTTVLNRFAPWFNVPCWCCCNSEKQPVQKRNGALMAWKNNPGDNIITLDELVKLDQFGIVSRWGGFGVFLGETWQNTLACMDLDHVFDDRGNLIHLYDVQQWTKANEIREFLDVAQTYVETSCSGSGLHVFFYLDKPQEEFKLKSSFSDGKFYTSRFIRLTGTIYAGYDCPVKGLSDRKFPAFKEKFAELEPITTRQKTTYIGTNHESWRTILCHAGIPFEDTSYEGKTWKGKQVLEAVKIDCPLKHMHKTDRPGDESAHKAILVRNTDGETAIYCVHDSCKGHGRLAALWNRIRQRRSARAKDTLKQMGVAV